MCQGSKERLPVLTTVAVKHSAPSTLRDTVRPSVPVSWRMWVFSEIDDRDPPRGKRSVQHGGPYHFR